MGPGNRGAVPDRSEVFVDKTGDGHLRVAYINRYVYAKNIDSIHHLHTSQYIRSLIVVI